MNTLTIGTLSRQSGIKVPTIRFYEEIGLLPPPPRTRSNRRSYGAEDVRRLQFIRHARDLGFGIDVIRALLAMASEPQSSCDMADSIALQHLATIDRRISQLTALKAELQRLVDECSHGRVSECRIIEALTGHSQCQHEIGQT